LSIQSKLQKAYGGRIKLTVENGCRHLTGTAKSWDESVEAGLMCAKKGGRTHVVNDITVEGIKIPETKLPSVIDRSLEGAQPDVLVIGAGVVGCAIARELSKTSLDVLLIDKEYDVALHASSRNDGMVHPGIDILPGLLKKKLNTRGNRMYTELCSELNVPFDRSGQYLCFKKSWLLPLLFLTKPYWYLSGAGSTDVISAKELHRREPDTSPDAKCAIYFKTAGSVCPYGLTIALAENAVSNGVKLSLETAVTGMEVENWEIVSVKTNRGTVCPKLVINAAGVFCEDIATLAEDRFYSIHPRKGTNAILDKKARKHISTIYSMIGTQSKSAHSKGGGVVGTVDGNVLVGPDAVETFEKENFATDAASIESTFFKHRQAAPWLSQGDIITYFTGVRSATYEEDFIVEKGRKTKNIIHVAGIQSPGLTAAPAIGEMVAGLVADYFPQIGKNTAFKPVRKPIVRLSELSDGERAKYIRKNPDYGVIVCRCEEISRGEILDALHRPVPCSTVDGVKRRCRPGMGRCQGGFCAPQVVKIIAENFNIAESEVRKAGEGSEILMGEKGAVR
jgi:glycerol-3-phosphate dehydrogenase